MAKGINISVASDTRDFSKGVKTGIIEPLEDAAEVLQDLAKEGDQASGKLEDGFKDAARQTEELKDDYKKLGKEINDAGKKGKSLGDDVTDGTRKAEAGIEDFKGEANSTAKEVAASFDGSAESIGSGFQEVAANAFAGFGPAGALAGIAAAAGIGFVFSKMEEGAEKTAAFKERVGELTQELIDSGDEAGPSLDYIVDRLKSLASESDEAETSLQDLYDVSKKSGSSFKDLAQVYAGNVDGLKDLQKEGKDYLKDLEDQADAIDTTTAAGEDNYGALLKQAEGQEEYNQYLSEAAKLAEEAAAQEEHYARSGAAAMEARTEAIQTLQGELDGAIGLYAEFTGTEDRAADPQGWIDAMQDRIDATSGFASNVTALSDKWNLTTAETQAILDEGLDFAPMLAAITGTPLEGEFIAKMQAAVSGGEEVLNGASLNTTVSVDANTDKAETNVRKTSDKKREAQIKVKDVDTSKASRAIDKVATKSRTAKVKVTVDKTAAETTLTNFIKKARTVKIKAQIVDDNGRKID